MPVSVYIKLSLDYSFSKLQPIHANLKAYYPTVMNVIGAHVLYHYIYKSIPALTFNIADIEESVTLSCADTHALGLLQTSDKLDINIPSHAKFITHQADRYKIHAISKNT